MLGVTAERFPRGGAFLLGLMGCVGNMAIGVVQPWMGGINDKITFAAIPAELQNQIVVPGAIDPGKVKSLPPEQQTIVAEAQKEGAKWSFRYVSVLPVVLIFIFGGIALTDRARGGYKPEILVGKDDCRPPSLRRTFSGAPTSRHGGWAIEGKKSNVRGTETIASKSGEMRPGATLTRRASEARWPRTVADAQPVPSLARRVGMGTALGERITFLTLSKLGLHRASSFYNR